MMGEVTSRARWQGDFQSGGWFQSIVETSPDGIWLLAEGGRILYANESMEKMLGVSREALLGCLSGDFEENGEGSSQRERGHSRREVQFRRGDGELFWGGVNECVDLLLEGDARAVVQIVRDLTEEKCTEARRRVEEEQLRESREQLSLAMTVSGIGLWDFNPQTEDVAVSPEYAKILGYDPETFTESVTLWAERIHPDDLGYVQKSLGDYLSGKSSFFSIEFRMKTAWDCWHWYHSMGRVVRRDREGKPIRMIGTTQNISERKAIEEEQLKMSTIVETSPDFMGVANMKGEYLYINQAGRRMLGLGPKEEILDRRFLEFLPEEEQVRFANEILPDLQKNSIWRGESKMFRSDKSGFIADMNRFMIRDPKSGEPVYIGNVMRDATERKLAEDELKRLNLRLEERVQEEVAKNREKDHLLIQQSRLAAMGEMIGNIAHQWRQPINALGLIVANLEDAWNFGQFSERYLHEQIDKATRLISRMSSTIDDFRNFFRPTKTSQSFGLYDATSDAFSLVRDAFAHHGVELHLEGDQSVTVEGYANEFSQAVLNVLVNARDAILSHQKGEGQVQVRIEREGERARVIIQDNGGGIPPEILPRIFDPYFTTRDKGTGIGLYMVRTIIETNMKGQILVSNTDGGARFVFDFPVSSGPSGAEAERKL